MPADRRRPALPAALLALPLALAAALSAACGGDALPGGDGDAAYGDGTWHGTMDTLEDGTVVVRNPAQGIWTEEQAWRIEEELRIGARSGQGPEVFGRVSALAVDSMGRVWVGDDQAHEIRVFDRRGRHVRSVGREGEGPGEFEGIAGLLAAGRWIVAVDLANNRYSVFDTTGAFLRDRPRPGMPRVPNPWRGALTASGDLVDADEFTRPDGAPGTLVVLDSLLETRRTVPFPRYTEGDEHYGPELVWRVGRSGTLWFGTANRYRIYALRAGGDTTRIVERAVEPEPRSEEEIDSEVARVNRKIRALPGGDGGGGVSAEDFAQVEPLFRSLWQDDAGRLWTARGGYADPPVRKIDVFDPRGRYLGRVTSDVGLRPRRAAPVHRGQRIWAVAEDTLGVDYVVRGRIVRPGGA